jgi:CheY-like chemotaxis protein
VRIPFDLGNAHHRQGRDLACECAHAIFGEDTRLERLPTLDRAVPEGGAQRFERALRREVAGRAVHDESRDRHAGGAETLGEVVRLAQRERLGDRDHDGSARRGVVQERLPAPKAVGDGASRCDAKDRVREVGERECVARCRKVEHDAREANVGSAALLREREEVMHHPELVERGSRVEHACEGLRMNRGVHEGPDGDDFAQEELLSVARLEARIREALADRSRLGARRLAKMSGERARSWPADRGLEEERFVARGGEGPREPERERRATDASLAGNEHDAAVEPGLHVQVDARRRAGVPPAGKSFVRSFVGKGTRGRILTRVPMSYRVLVADDSSVVRALYVACLERAGYEVVQCGNGREALQAVRSYMPDAVLSDISMPELDGVQLIEEIRALDDDLLAAIPVVLITAWDDEEDRARANKVGAAKILLKPVDASDLREALEEAINTAQTAVHV